MKKVDLKIWKTVKLGTCKDINMLYEALKQTGRGIGGWAEKILGAPFFMMAPKEKEIDLVIVSNSSLGRPQGCLFGETIELALSVGLEKCPAEVGPQLYLQYFNKFEREFCVGMDPIMDSYGHFAVFFLGCGCGKEAGLDACDGRLGCFRSGDSFFVFALRR